MSDPITTAPRRFPYDRPPQDNWLLQLAAVYSQRSTCMRRAAAAIGIDHLGRVVGIGYNGVPRGWVHCLDQPCQGEHIPGDSGQENSPCRAIHAEQNLLLLCQDTYRIVKIAVTTTPCRTCALMIANLPNIKTVIAGEKYHDEMGLFILEKSHIEVRILGGR